MIVKRKKFKGGVNPPMHLGIIVVQLKLLVGMIPIMLMLMPLPLGGVIMLTIPMLVIGAIIKPLRIALIGVLVLLKTIILLVTLGTQMKMLKVVVIGSNNLKPMKLGMETKVRKMKILLPMDQLQLLLNLKKITRLLTNIFPRKLKSQSIFLFQKLENLMKELMILSGKMPFLLKKKKKMISFLLGKLVK